MPHLLVAASLCGLVWSGLLSGAALAQNTPAPDAPSPAGALVQAVQRLPDEGRQILGYPLDHPAEAGRYALGVLALVALDKPLTRAWQQRVEKPLQGFKLPDAPGPFRNAGTGGTDGWLVLGVGSTWLGGWALGDAQAERTGLAAGKAIGWSLLVSEVLLKTVTGRKRPQDPWHPEANADGSFTDNPWDFGHARRPRLPSGPYGTSMPSFHVTAWFATAKVYADAYQQPWLAYGALTLGLASDIQSHRHWVSDMVAGALIGTGIGHVVGAGAPASNGQTGWQWGPGLTPSGAPALQWQARF